MQKRLAAAVVCALVPWGPAAVSSADPAPDPAPAAADAVAPPPDGAVPSAEPGVLITPEGWTLTVAGRDEAQVAVNPLTTAVSSREYLVSGTFTGSVTGHASTKLAGGTLEAGYQIGCGIAMDKVKLTASAGIAPSGSILGIPTGVSFPLQAAVEVSLKPGEVNNIPVVKKEYKATETRISVHHVHVKIDGCAGQSFLRSYAILTSKNDLTDDVIAYYGVTKSV